jgi:hypothetical protein
MSGISSIYRIYFTWLEPVFATSGAYLCHARPGFFLETSTPSPVIGNDVTPTVQLLLTQIASLYIMHALVMSTVLRASNEINVWRAVMFAIAIADSGHLYALYAAAPGPFLDLATWRSEDWTNYGILGLGLVLRVAFLLGIGNRK